MLKVISNGVWLLPLVFQLAPLSFAYTCEAQCKTLAVPADETSM
jgi:hypothetical protein